MDEVISIVDMENSPKTESLMNKSSAIYRRPLNVRHKKDGNFFYTPRIVSFGPYHHDDECCQQTNKTKENDYVDALREDVKNLKEAYNKLEPKWEEDDDAFLQMMIFDGCFLLQTLHEGNHLGHLSQQVLNLYEISQNELMEYYRHDMLLLENQLPMQFLEKLLAVQKDLSIEEAQEGLYKLILAFFALSSPNIEKQLLRQEGKRMHLHVLDLYRCSLLNHDQHEGKSASSTVKDAIKDREVFSFLVLKILFTSKCGLHMIIPILFFLISLLIGFLTIFPLSIIVLITLCPLFAVRYYMNFIFKVRPGRNKSFIIPSATELNKAGIDFCVRTEGSDRIISLHGDNLSLQQIYADGATKSTLLNIIAFEQFCLDVEKVVTSYIYFMSRLVQAQEDVRILQLNDIINTMLHTDEVVELFKSLTKRVFG